MSRPLSRSDLWIPAMIGVAGLSALLFLGYEDPYPTPWLQTLQRPMLAVSIAAFAAVIPGFFETKLTLPGIVVRATSALGVFLVVFYSNPISTDQPRANETVVTVAANVPLEATAAPAPTPVKPPAQ